MNELQTKLQTIHWKELFQTIVNWHCFWPIVITILVLFIIWRIICRRHRVINLTSHDEGKISVVRTALIDLIENTCNDIVPNSKPRVCLCEKGGKLNLRIKIRIFSDQNIERTTSAIQKEVSHVLHDTLGLENIGTINLLIAGFRKSPSKKTSGSEDTPDYP